MAGIVVDKLKLMYSQVHAYCSEDKRFIIALRQPKQIPLTFDAAVLYSGGGLEAIVAAEDSSSIVYWSRGLHQQEMEAYFEAVENHARYQLEQPNDYTAQVALEAVLSAYKAREQLAGGRAITTKDPPRAYRAIVSP
jgi:hypothetical protein